ncbi:uncharacterized protein SPSK_05677 [Sporothrix schenckii 1099-18]|uniref:Uncharacterized protein n=1 Tax=Sporothrix schenckii 1099-18 TaxID=1397361 RepID=A0A0F2LY94_SPOSC|nr:uncharacterized protein SPSK_05677 [Sporothrix schenckii 1099-18]KJR80876.1 hypothetical protein SPSK_05677 [Sporothrix schenckii 1099-18]
MRRAAAMNEWCNEAQRARTGIDAAGESNKERPRGRDKRDERKATKTREKKERQNEKKNKDVMSRKGRVRRRERSCRRSPRTGDWRGSRALQWLQHTFPLIKLYKPAVQKEWTQWRRRLRSTNKKASLYGKS